MDPAASETTQDWLLPVGARPPTIGQLEQRIELALVTARASEAAVMTVGAAALDAAEQAKRAAELAEKASAAIAAAGAPAAPRPRREPRSGDDDLRSFHAQADRLTARLRQLQRVPLGADQGT